MGLIYGISRIERFIKAQEKDFYTALREVKNGRKTSHWMWYIFYDGRRDERTLEILRAG